MEWISVEERLPEVPVPVLAAYVNVYGGPHVVRAILFGRFELEAHEDADDEDVEFRGEDGGYYSPAGWYEAPDNGDYYGISRVTHWMPLPAHPSKGG